MSEAYGDALSEQARQNVWQTLKQEARNMSPSDAVGLTADVAGIFDPTPISDGVGGVISLAKGDWLGAGLSVLGMIPYIGDTGKIAKIAKRAPRTAALLTTVMTRGDNLAKAGADFLKSNFTMRQIAAARKAAAKRVQEAMLKAKQGIKCKDCAKLKQGSTKRKLQMPSGKTGGKWKGGKQPPNGTGTFVFDKPVKLPAPDGRTVSEIEYKDGFPDFSPYVANGKKYEIWDVTGNAATDEKSLLKQYGDGALPSNPDDYTLHHFEDGSLGYVPNSIHNKAEGGAAHTGGNSIVNNDLF
jgi:hypothetical protein